MPPDLIDPDDGENRAVRSFLLAYGTHGLTVGMMRTNMRLSGWDGLWPEWVNTQPETAHLTKGGAQHWLRHLFSLETAAGVREHCPTCGADEPYTGACGTSKDDTRALCRRSTPGVKGDGNG